MATVDVPRVHFLFQAVLIEELRKSGEKLRAEKTALMSAFTHSQQQFGAA